jgi:hypothetical protein
MNRIKLWIGKAGARLAAWCGSPAPDWYSSQELWEVLRREESPHIANRLSVEYAKNLQLAFNKGWAMGYSKGKQENLRVSQPRLESPV